MNRKTIFFSKTSNLYLNQNSVFFITGCSSGFGKELVIEALSRGYKVVATTRNLPDLDYLKNLPGEHYGLYVDITNLESILEAVKKTIDKFGRIDVLVNNAGMLYRSEFLNAEEEKIRAIFETNVFGTLNVTRIILPIMRAQKSGTIVNISSQTGFSSTFGSFFYSVSKYTMEGITANLRREEKETRGAIRVLSVNPGFFKTDIMLKGAVQKGQQKWTDYSRYPSSAGNAQFAAKQIISTIEQPKLPSRLILGKDALIKFKETRRLMRADLSYNKKLVINRKTNFRFSDNFRMSAMIRLFRKIKRMIFN